MEAPAKEERQSYVNIPPSLRIRISNIRMEIQQQQALQSDERERSIGMTSQEVV